MIALAEHFWGIQVFSQMNLVADTPQRNNACPLMTEQLPEQSIALGMDQMTEIQDQTSPTNVCQMDSHECTSSELSIPACEPSTF
jgi:hypothetical protein